jgi:hypothetical protein
MSAAARRCRSAAARRCRSPLPLVAAARRFRSSLPLVASGTGDSQAFADEKDGRPAVHRTEGPPFTGGLPASTALEVGASEVVDAGAATRREAAMSLRTPS